MPGYLKNPEVDELPLPSDPSFVVAMKRRGTWGDSNAAQSALVKVSTEAVPNGNGNGRPAQLPSQKTVMASPQAQAEANVVTESEIGAYLRTLVTRMIVHWNVTDQEGRVLPINEQTVELLEVEDGDFLAKEAQKRLGVKAEADQGPFSRNSAQQSTTTQSKTKKS